MVLALALPLFTAARPVSAQYGTDEKQQTFDYVPVSNISQVPKETVSVDYEDAEMITDPVRGVYMVSKSRWKSWVARAGYLLMIDIALLVMLLSLPRNEGHNFIIAYMLSGASAVLSFWVSLCAWLLWRLGASVWMFILPLSLVMAAATYIILMRINRSDVSLTEIRVSFRKISGLSEEDPRLASIDGQPGDWPNQDFIK